MHIVPLLYRPRFACVPGLPLARDSQCWIVGRVKLRGNAVGGVPHDSMVQDDAPEHQWSASPGSTSLMGFPEEARPPCCPSR